MISIRTALPTDLPKLLEIYNYEVEHGVATFDTKPLTLEERALWMSEHNVDNHPLIVADEDGIPVGYATLSSFNPKAAYASTVELSVYVDAAKRGKGLGRALMEAIITRAKEDPRTHRVISIITGENAASIALHEKLGFKRVGTITEAGTKFGRWLDVIYFELAV